MRNVKIFFTSLSLIFLISCSDDEIPEPPSNPAGPTTLMDDAIIWTGADITFAKADGADPTVAANQDRINDDVWITRGINGGEIFNIRSEMESTKGSSPRGTEWAMGTTDNVANLTFRPFRTAVGEPQDVVGQDLVLHLIAEDIFLNVRFTSWTRGRDGGFAYERATP